MKFGKKLAAGLLAGVMAVNAAPAMEVSAGAEAEAPRSYEIDYTKDGLYELDGDGYIYVNGKDRKQNGEFYKTCTFQYAGRTLGGKLNVAVLPGEVGVTEYNQFFVDGKVRPDIAKAGKQYASARIDQNGKVTVTAGKKSGEVYILVYEVVDKKLVHSGDGGIGEKYNVDPLYTNVIINAAPSAVLYTTDPSKLIWVTENVYVDEAGTAYTSQSPLLKKSDSTVTLSVGETVTLYLADKKAIPSDWSEPRCDATYIATSYDGTIVGLGNYYYNGEVESEWSYFDESDGMPKNTHGNYPYFTLKGVRAGKTTLVIENKISGKTAKVKVVVK